MLGRQDVLKTVGARGEKRPRLFDTAPCATEPTVPMWAASTTGTVSGSVTDDSGSIVAGAGVLISYAAPANAPHSSSAPTIAGPIAARVQSDSSGQFGAAALPPGQYVACAEASTPGLLNPCSWATSAPTFTVNAGQTTAGVKIVMLKGTVLPIHVNDPLGLLKTVAGPVDFDLEIHVVTPNGAHYGAPIQAQTSSGRDYAIAIPFGAGVAVRVLSADFTVTDQSGNAVVPAGASVTVPVGAAPQQISYTVTGQK
jgi:hypothetical protein